MSGAAQFAIIVTQTGKSWEASGLGLESAGRTPYEAVRNWNFELAEESISYALKWLEDAGA